MENSAYHPPELPADDNYRAGLREEIEDPTIPDEQYLSDNEFAEGQSDDSPKIKDSLTVTSYYAHGGVPETPSREHPQNIDNRLNRHEIEELRTEISEDAKKAIIANARAAKKVLQQTKRNS